MSEYVISWEGLAKVSSEISSIGLGPLPENPRHTERPLSTCTIREWISSSNTTESCSDAMAIGTMTLLVHPSLPVQTVLFLNSH